MKPYDQELTEDDCSSYLGSCLINDVVIVMEVVARIFEARAALKFEGLSNWVVADTEGHDNDNSGVLIVMFQIVYMRSWTGYSPEISSTPPYTFSPRDDAQLPASLILAHETEELMIWLGRNAGRLAACHLELTAVASRSSIQLLNEQQAGSATPLACAGYRIDF
ncbi:unnamed protein product [Echinostoma caproni]|uniref:Gelsolin-like domain-containing protein n=1 Tax=Echinostoma caproni TaxID=27848 RepID=A0A183ADF3_9TREM|nr:unnamed protein product [Echinostoma caproni]